MLIYTPILAPPVRSIIITPATRRTAPTALTSGLESLLQISTIPTIGIKNKIAISIISIDITFSSLKFLNKLFKPFFLITIPPLTTIL